MKVLILEHRRLNIIYSSINGNGKYIYTSPMYVSDTMENIIDYIKKEKPFHCHENTCWVVHDMVINNDVFRIIRILNNDGEFLAEFPF